MATNISNDLSIVFDNIESYYNYIPVENPILKASIVLLISVLIAYLVWLIFKTVLRNIVKGTKTEVDDKLIKKSEMPSIALVIISGFFIVGKILDLDLYVGLAYNRIFYTIFTLIIFILVYNIVMILLEAAKSSIPGKKLNLFDEKVYPFFEISGKIILAIIYLFIFFGIWNINLAPLLASAGILGVALGFAAKDSVANIFGGIALYLDKTYKIGDYIIIEDKDRGEVVDISLRSTKIKTRDNILVTIPNSVLANSKIINETGHDPKMRVRLDIEVAYDADLEKVEKVLLDVAKKAEYVLTEPQTRVRFREYKDSSVSLQILFWIKEPVYRGRYTHFLVKDIYKAFKKNKIEFPYPTQDINIKEFKKN